MSVLLTLICHASTQAVREVTFPVDEPLDASGLAKASAMAATIRRVDAAWTSPALRARQTAAALNLNATADDGLKDIDLGAWSGQSFDAIAESDAEGLAVWTRDCSAAPHGGETVVSLIERVAEWLALVGQSDGRIIAVTHAAIVRAAIITALDANPAAFWRIDVAPLCQVRLRGQLGRWSLLSMKA